jgi:hypothetical protein
MITSWKTTRHQSSVLRKIKQRPIILFTVPMIPETVKGMAGRKFEAQQLPFSIETKIKPGAYLENDNIVINTNKNIFKCQLKN